MNNLLKISNPVRNKFLNGANGVKILLVWPKFQDTFWSFKYALPFLGKKAASPPLGLLTVAALLPKEWEKKLVDLNVGKLKEKDVLEADFIFLSAMIAQKKSVKEIIKTIKQYNNNKKIVAGGPLFTTGYENYLGEIDPVRNKPPQAAAAVPSAGRISNGVEKNIVKIVEGDGSKGYEEEAPFDKIIAAAAALAVPQAWKDQLKVGGQIVAPVGHNIVLLQKKSPTEFSQKQYYGFSFVPLIVDKTGA